MISSKMNLVASGFHLSLFCLVTAVVLMVTEMHFPSGLLCMGIAYIVNCVREIETREINMHLEKNRIDLGEEKDGTIWGLMEPIRTCKSTKNFSTNVSTSAGRSKLARRVVEPMRKWCFRQAGDGTGIESSPASARTDGAPAADRAGAISSQSETTGRGALSLL